MFLLPLIQPFAAALEFIIKLSHAHVLYPNTFSRMEQDGGNPDNNIGLELLVNPNRKISRDAISTMSSPSSRGGGGGGGGGSRDRHSRRVAADSDKYDSDDEGVADVMSSVSRKSYRSKPSGGSYGNRNRERRSDDDMDGDVASVSSVSYRGGGGGGGRSGYPDKNRNIHKAARNYESDRSSSSRASSVIAPRSHLSKQFRPRPEQNNPRYMSEEEVYRDKRDMLNYFHRLETLKGYVMQRKFTMSSPLEDMKDEYERVKKDVGIDSSVKFMRNCLITCVMGVEHSAEYFIPDRSGLQGWSSVVTESINEYDEVFEEFHEMYGQGRKMDPRLRFMFMLGGSAVMHHMNNKMYESKNVAPPPPPQYQYQYPDGGYASQQPPPPSYAHSQSPHPTADTSGFGGILGAMGSAMGGLFGVGGGERKQSSFQPPPPISRHQGTPDAGSRGGGSMKGPNVDDLLRELQENAIRDENERIEVVSTVTDSDVVEELKGEDGIDAALLFNDSNAASKDAVNAAPPKAAPPAPKKAAGGRGRGGAKKNTIVLDA